VSYQCSADLTGKLTHWAPGAWWACPPIEFQQAAWLRSIAAHCHGYRHHNTRGRGAGKGRSLRQRPRNPEIDTGQSAPEQASGVAVACESPPVPPEEVRPDHSPTQAHGQPTPHRVDIADPYGSYESSHHDCKRGCTAVPEQSCILIVGCSSRTPYERFVSTHTRHSQCAVWLKLLSFSGPHKSRNMCSPLAKPQPEDNQI